MGTTAVEVELDPFIFKLPDEVLIKIIDLLPMAQWPSLEMICHRFEEIMHGMWMRTREIRMDELVYNEETKLGNPSHILDSALRKFLHRAPNIVSISGFGDEFCDERRRLQRYTIALMTQFRHLEAIEFTRQDHFSPKKVLSAKKMAVFLEMSASRQCFKSLSATAGVYKLQEEEDRWNRSLGGNDDLPTMHLEAFEITTYHLESFSFCQSFDWASLKKLIIDCHEMPANDLIWNLKQCIQIEHLHLTVHCFNQSQAQVFEVVAGLEKLSVLHLSRSFRHGAPPFQDALVSLIHDLGRRRRITDFALSDCNDQIVHAVVAYMPFLKSLELRVDKVSESSKMLLVTEMKCLEALKLRNYDGPTVNVEVVRALVANLVDLKCLYLTQLPWSLRNFESASGLRKLKELSIPRMAMFDGAVFDSWARLGFGTRLEGLELNLKDEAAVDAMIAWIKSLPRLRLLNLTSVTNGLLLAIADSCPMLRKLTLGRSPSISRGEIQHVIDRCSQLQVIRIWVRRWGIGEPLWFPDGLKVGKYRKIKFMRSLDF